MYLCMYLCMSIYNIPCIEIHKIIKFLLAIIVKHRDTESFNAFNIEESQIVMLMTSMVHH